MSILHKISDEQFETPILIIIYNRPDLAKKVIRLVQRIKPKRLFIAADGPKSNNLIEIKKCQDSRNISKTIDWDCELKTLFQKTNLGCGKGPATAITWFFNHVEEGIILEDDCIPDLSFFLFCQDLLKKYKNNDRIMHISGSNFQFGIQRGDGSYYFSRYAEVWGWATWERAWQHFDYDLNFYQSFVKSGVIKKTFSNKRVQNYWLRKLNYVFNTRNVDIWDFQWLFAIWHNQGLSITPNQNLVSNQGFRKDGTHTFHKGYPTSNIKSKQLESIKYIKNIEIDCKADELSFTMRYDVPRSHKVFNRTHKYISKLYHL